MNPSEPPRERLSPQPPAIQIESVAGRRSGAQDEDEFQPRYLDLPSRRERGHGRRNLVWAVALLLATVALLAWALSLAGARAALTLGTCLATTAALFALARARLLRQRNGGFLALAVVCLLGVGIALLEEAWMTARTNVAAREAAEVMKSESATAGAKSATTHTTPEPPLLTKAFNIAPPEPGRGQQVKVLKDSQLLIDGKVYLLKTGELFPLVEAVAGEVRFAAGEQQIALPTDAVEILGKRDPGAASLSAANSEPRGAIPQSAGPPATETPAKITERAQREAIRRYPSIGVKDSPENELFVSTVKEMQNIGSTGLFRDPEWPLRLAEQLARQEGWERRDEMMERAPTPQP